MIWLILAFFGPATDSFTAGLVFARPDTAAAFAARPAAHAHAAKTTYVCPMHSDVVSDSPGHCPKCNMKLSPKLEVTELRHGRAVTWVLA